MTRDDAHCVELTSVNVDVMFVHCLLSLLVVKCTYLCQNIHNKRISCFLLSEDLYVKRCDGQVAPFTVSHF